MKPRFSLPLLPLLGVLACVPAETPQCPEPLAATPQPGPTAEDPPPATPATPAPPVSATGIRAASDFPLSSNCEAPLAITQEVTRLLAAAAAHGTRSAACVDGRGQRLAVNDILVCPAAPEAGDTIVDAFYQVATYPEGDTRGCAQPDADCSWLEPSASEHQVTLRLRPGKDGHVSLVDLAALPGFPADATPLAEVHDGNCYGQSPAFEPRPLKLGR